MGSSSNLGSVYTFGFRDRRFLLHDLRERLDLLPVLPEDFFLFASASSSELNSSSSRGDGIKLSRILGNGLTSIMTASAEGASQVSDEGAGGLFFCPAYSLYLSISMGLGVLGRSCKNLGSGESGTPKLELALSISSNLTTLALVDASCSFFSSPRLLFFGRMIDSSCAAANPDPLP